MNHTTVGYFLSCKKLSLATFLTFEYVHGVHCYLSFYPTISGINAPPLLPPRVLRLINIKVPVEWGERPQPRQALH
jgi:hypothetical protein